MNAPVLVLLEHDRGEVSETTFQAIACDRSFGNVHAVLIGTEADAAVAELGSYGVEKVWLVHHDALRDYAPEAWGDALAQLAQAVGTTGVMSTGTDRGNEVMAHVAAVLELPLATNVLSAETNGSAVSLTRSRWGGSLIERASISAPVLLLTTAMHAYPGEPMGNATTPTTEVFVPTLDDDLAGRTRIVDRVTLAAGITLTTAPVVVSGGRGVGSPEGFAMLEELAGLLGGAVGCSRVVTNNGWRPHSDQVGQTGKRVAPELYIACGISGAIQHWVGMMAAKKVLAINTDKDANMVSKADYAVIGDLHEVLPALVAELRSRRV